MIYVFEAHLKVFYQYMIQVISTFLTTETKGNKMEKIMIIRSPWANKITPNICGPFYKYPKIAINIGNMCIRRL